MILLMGIAGSGKGTQGKRLADQHKLHLLSMGDVLRMYITGEQRDQMLAGGLLDDQEIIQIVDKVMGQIPNEEEVLLDGFPRTIPQAVWLLDKAKKDGFKFKIHLVIHLVASRDAVKERLLKRARLDDKEDVIEARFDEYERSTMPLLKWLSDHGVKVNDVDAERPVAEVNRDLVNLLKSVQIN